MPSHDKNERYTTRRSMRQIVQESEDGAEDISIEPDESPSSIDNTKPVLEDCKKGNALKTTNEDILLPDRQFPCHPGNELYRETVKCFHLQRVVCFHRLQCIGLMLALIRVCMLLTSLALCQTMCCR